MIDFDYLILSNQIYDDNELKDTLAFFSNLGVKRFIVSYLVDLSCQSFRRAQNSVKALQYKLSSICPRGVTVHVQPALSFEKDAVKNPAVSSFAFGNRMILCQMPLQCVSHSNEWMDENLHYLIRKLNLRPIFISFEQFLRLNNKETVDHLLHASGLSFAPDLNYMTASESLSFMERSIIQNISIFPSVSHDLSCYRGVEKAFLLLKKRMGDERYIQFCRNLHTNGIAVKDLHH